MNEFFSSTTLMLALLNPFFVIVYLLELLERLPRPTFRSILIRAGIIASVVFCCFAILGDAIFTRVIQADFASFQIFGGIVLLLIGLRFMFHGPKALELLRGEPKHVAGAVAMPVLIGPGSLSASVIIGKRCPPLAACLAIVLAVCLSIIIMLLLKGLYDYVRPRREELVKRYVEIMGRVMALYVGTISIELIFRGLKVWVKTLCNSL